MRWKNEKMVECQQSFLIVHRFRGPWDRFDPDGFSDILLMTGKWTLISRRRTGWQKTTGNPGYNNSCSINPVMEKNR
jgi:hypothetical protein